MGFSPNNKHNSTTSLVSQVDASTGDFTGDVTLGEDLIGLIESAVVVILVPTDRSYPVEQHAQVAYTIVESRHQTTAGSLTASVTINGTIVEGLDNVTVSGAQESATATSANSVSIGDKITLVVSGSSSPTDLQFALKLKRA